MASRLREAIGTRGTHKVGTLNTKDAKRVVNGAILTTANVDNFTIVELCGYDEDGNKLCKPLSNKANKGFLVTTVEEEQLMEIGGVQEEYLDFFNKIGEICQLTRLDSGVVRFETDDFKLNSGVTKLILGYVAHFDVANQEYIISNPASAHADYAGSSNKFEVVTLDTDFGYGLDTTTIRLESIA